jgi:YHS domain-containing protein
VTCEEKKPVNFNRASRRRIAGLVFTLTVLVGIPVGVAGAAAREPVNPVNVTNGLGLKGYDPVAYFSAGEATPGRQQCAYRWKGVIYRFASAENRDRFTTDPDKYLPQYGGYCAYAMSIDRIADIDPARWAIVDGKLYLNNGRISQTLWSIDKAGHIASADRNWVVFPKLAEGS